jgi:predicted N-acyltransferase
VQLRPYETTVVERAADVDAAAWEAGCGLSKNPFLDLRFLSAVESSFADEARFWYATFHDDDERAVACACFSQYLVDGALMAPAAIQGLVGGIRRLWPEFFKYKILLCGVPVSTCGNQLGVAPGADSDRLIPALDALALELARQSGCGLISFKEFPPVEAERIASLTGSGFLQARSVVAYHLPGEFGSFENYMASRSKRTRAKIRRHFRKFEEGGLTCEQLRGRDGVERLFTDDVHRLYLNVLNRAHVKFERIPANFFRHLARQLPDESHFTFIRQNDRIVAFCCGVGSPGAHTMLFCGLDYSLNAQADLYFNTIYRGLAAGLIPGVRLVNIGASADEFKQHMGCRGESLSIYVKAVGTIRQFLFKQVFGLLFDTSPAPSAMPAVEIPADRRKAA